MSTRALVTGVMVATLLATSMVAGDAWAQRGPREGGGRSAWSRDAGRNQDQADNRGGNDGAYRSDRQDNRGGNNGAYRSDRQDNRGGNDGAYRSDRQDNRGRNNGAYRSDRNGDRAGHSIAYRPTRFTQRNLSPSRVVVTVGRNRYFYDGGRFFRSGPYGYTLVAAPLGAWVPRLPFGFTIVYNGALPYYYCAGTYYASDPSNGGYVVANPPQSANNFDVITMADGSSLTGHYVGGTETTIQFEVGGTIYDVDRANVVSVSLAPQGDQ